MLGEGGYVPANERFFAGLRKRADQYGILLVVDEVQTGFGRTGKFWGGEHFDAKPDILITAKGLQLVADKHDRITDVRGVGLMIGNEFRDADGKPDPATATAAQQEAARRGLLLLTCGAWGQVVRFIPALVVTADQVDEAAGIWADAVGAVVPR